MLRQCGWCKRLKDERGDPQGEPLPGLLPDATHGICAECYARERANLRRRTEREQAVSMIQVYALDEPTLPGYRVIGSSQQGEDMELWYLEKEPR